MRGTALQALRLMKKWEEGLQVLDCASPAVCGEDLCEAAVPLQLVKVHRDHPQSLEEPQPRAGGCPKEGS